jgi:hypothetical protein
MGSGALRGGAKKCREGKPELPRLTALRDSLAMPVKGPPIILILPIVIFYCLPRAFPSVAFLPEMII